jgi:DMSO/TMAO reductase YedYZ molybdopterin-dependent catalytic subunit
MTKRAWLLPFGVGLLATAALVGLLLLLSRVSPLSFVPLDIADAIIHLTPGGIATQGIETLGPGAKLLIELSGSAIFIAMGGVVAILYARLAPRRLVGAGVVLALIALALTALVQQLAGGLRGGVVVIALTSLLYLLWGWALAWLINRLVVPTPSQDVDGPRRTFLFASGGGLLAVAVGSTAIAQLLARNGDDAGPVAGAGQALPTRGPQTATTTVPSTTPAAERTAAATSAAQPAPTAAGTVTPDAPTSAPTLAPTAEPTPVPFTPAPGTRSPFNTNETLYVISSATRDPVVDKDAWRLEIGGAVERPFSLRYDELLALARVDQTSTMECISNEVGNYLIGNVKWNGVALKDLLERAGVQDGVVDIKLTAAEGYTESIPLAKAMEPSTLVVYGIDGEALAVKHGFPARLRVPGLYGEKNVKRLTRVEAVREDYKGYWQQRGWTDTAIIETTSVFDSANPFLGAAPPLKRENGVVPLGGIAFAGNRGIRSVEVRVNDGAWQPAQLDPVDDPLTWRFWRYDWRVDPGSYTLSVRAVDGAGAPQIETERPPHPDGATGLMRITVDVE